MYGYTRYYSHILSKNVHSLRSTLSHNHILSKIRPFSQKQIAVMWLFSIFLWKTPCCHAHSWSKKHQYWQNYTILWTVKSIRCSLFRLFMKKSPLQCSHFVTNLHSQKKICPQAYILSKNINSFKNTVFPCDFFFQISHEKTPCRHAHIWSRKISILSKLHYCMGQNSQ